MGILDFASLVLFDQTVDSFVKELVIPGEGIYSIATGTGISLEFQPFQEFTGETTPVNYSFSDAAEQMSNQATIRIEVEAPTFIITNPMIYQRVQ